MEINENTCPCSYCLILSICKARSNQDGPSSLLVWALNNCKLLRQYVVNHEYGNHIVLSDKNLLQFGELFNISITRSGSDIRLKSKNGN